ncbi:hypothetical protein K470DRAFT_296807 [Piedraia hortae CBS 480.64]|uniref:F-box domain-containing protein n=1 Tax=Piedraia hortae CBS 480.64 TaxID=1314780 RepID=A0A6A7BT08_9PEZI|nr:hypothetical protein K470DRAFT_296807 [Piedraia hortae CBS 480.64]
MVASALSSPQPWWRLLYQATCTAESTLSDFLNNMSIAEFPPEILLRIFNDLTEVQDTVKKYSMRWPKRDNLGNKHRPRKWRNSLVASSLVCKSWAAVASSVLWRKASLSALADISSTSRQHEYAALIQELEINSTKRKVLDNVEELSFLRLRSLTIRHGLREYLEQKDMIVHILRPSLTTLNIYNGLVLEELMPFIAVKCADLRRLLVGSIPMNWTTDHVYEILECNPHLEYLEINGHGIEKPKHVSASNFRVALGSRRAAGRPRLNELKMHVDDSLASLFPQIGNQLKDLDLSITTSSPLLLHAISQLVHLEKLHINFFPNRAELSRDELVSLSSLHKMRDLKLWGIFDMPQDDDAYANLFSKLSGLESLVFEAMIYLADEDFRTENPLTTKVLTSLGRSCPGLKRCHLRGPFELLDLQSEPGVLFPNLVYLRLGNVYLGNTPEDRPAITTTAIQAILKTHAPLLELFEVGNRNDVADPISSEPLGAIPARFSRKRLGGGAIQRSRENDQRVGGYERLSQRGNFE